MDTWYWALEYVRVFFAYVMILFVWPSVVFRDYLRGRSRTVRFAFCVTVPVVLLNTVVLSLGVFHILYGWLIAVLFYGTLLLGLLRSKRSPACFWEPTASGFCCFACATE